MTWRLARSLMALRAQVNAAWPNRNKAADGTIGDAAHSTRASDHNPDSNDVVAAIDITDDDSVGADMAKVSENLRKSKDPRIKYVIHGGRYFSPKTGWQWRTYTGINAHKQHMHVSVQSYNYDQTYDWQIGPEAGDDDMPQFNEEEEKTLKEIAAAIKREGSNGDAVGIMIKVVRWLRTKFPGEAP